jgi:hypothetical protein
LVLGGVHAAVDLACAFVLFRDLDAPGAEPIVVATWIVVYDSLAFAAQLPLALLGDRLAAYRAMSLAGVAIVLAALWIGPTAPRGAAATAGVGNSLFHVGAGAHVLRASGPRAAEVGFFVGPGALGLSLGILLGHGTAPCRAPLAAALLGAILGVAWAVRPAGSSETDRAGPRSGIPATAAWIGVGLLLLTVALRSGIGDNLAAPWRARSATITAALAIAATVGKIAGGAVADRLGWVRTGGSALALAAPLVALGPQHPFAAFVGMLLLQSTTPLTVKAIHAVIPSRPGVAFGAPSAALLLGSLPGLLGAWLHPVRPALLGATLLSAVAVVAGLFTARRRSDIIQPTLQAEHPERVSSPRGERW